MHSELPFMNVLLNVITLTVHPRRWYYAGCVNNMKEQQYLLLFNIMQDNDTETLNSGNSRVIHRQE